MSSKVGIVAVILVIATTTGEHEAARTPKAGAVASARRRSVPARPHRRGAHWQVERREWAGAPAPRFEDWASLGLI
ncbi:hypothetical protein [Sinomonas atrocyanea]